MKIENIRLLFFIVLLPFCCSAIAQPDTGGYFSSFDKVKIYYEVKGEGKPIVLIHGFTGNGSGWKKTALYDSLLANGFKVVLVDLRGNGNSDKPAVPEAYANDAEARDVMGLLQYLGVKKYEALGYSRGSIILARVLVLDKNCTRAVMGGMGTDFTNPLWPRRIGFYNALMNDTISGYEEFRKSIASRGLNPIVLACQQKEQPSTSAEVLGKLTQPVLIICGDRDEDNGKASDLQKMIPHSTFVTVPGTHNTTSSTPAFAHQVLSFLKE
jgi:pimeloyl-ACP methyl ester carboxylesterase